MALSDVPKLFQLASRVEGLFKLEQSFREAIEKITVKLTAVEERVARLEGRDEVMAAKAATAAASAASVAMADLARRLGVLEERLRTIEAGKQLPPRPYD